MLRKSWLGSGRPAVAVRDTWYPAAVPLTVEHRVIALAERLEGYESSALVGPVWIAHELRRIVREGHS